MDNLKLMDVDVDETFVHFKFEDFVSENVHLDFSISYELLGRILLNLFYEIGKSRKGEEK